MKNKRIETGSEQHEVYRDDAPTLVFTGDLLAEDSNRGCYGNGDTRWTIKRLYQTDSGKYVVEVIDVTQWQGEVNKHKAFVCENTDEAKARLGQDEIAKSIYHDAGIENVERI